MYLYYPLLCWNTGFHAVVSTLEGTLFFVYICKYMGMVMIQHYILTSEYNLVIPQSCVFVID